MACSNLWGRPLGLPKIAAEVIQASAVGTRPDREYLRHSITVATLAEELSQREERLHLQALPFFEQAIFEIPRDLGGARFALGRQLGVVGLRGKVVDESQLPVIPVRRL